MDRDTLEAAKKVCIEYSMQKWHEYKRGNGEGRANPIWEGQSDGAEECARLIDALAQQAGDGWISVSERLPAPGNSYLVVYCGTVTVASRYLITSMNKQGWAVGDDDVTDEERETDEITHWRPLPAPPTNTAAGSGGQSSSTTDSQESPAAERCQSAVPQGFTPLFISRDNGGGEVMNMGEELEWRKQNVAPQERPAETPVQTHDTALSSTIDVASSVSQPAVAAPLTLPEEPTAFLVDGCVLCIRKPDYDALRYAAEQAVAEAKHAWACCSEYTKLLEKEERRAEAAEAQVAALTEAYAAACIRLQALGEKTVPLTEQAARSVEVKP